MNNKTYVIGGYGASSSQVLTTNREYDPTTDKWTNRADMIFLHWGYLAAAANNKIYAIGGLFTEEYNLGLFQIHKKN